MGHDSFYGSLLGLAGVLLGALAIGRIRLGGIRGLFKEHKNWVVAISGEVSAVVAGALAAQAGFLDDTDLLRGTLLFIVLGQLGSTLVGMSFAPASAE